MYWEMDSRVCKVEMVMTIRVVKEEKSASYEFTWRM